MLCKSAESRLHASSMKQRLLALACMHGGTRGGTYGGGVADCASNCTFAYTLAYATACKLHTELNGGTALYSASHVTAGE
jgi:hypothetical protein